MANAVRLAGEVLALPAACAGLIIGLGSAAALLDKLPPERGETITVQQGVSDHEQEEDRADR